MLRRTKHYLFTWLVAYSFGGFNCHTL